MQHSLKQSVWRQFGASLETLKAAIKLCPDELWDTDKLFWYWSYHCLFFTDYYLSLDPLNFSPPEPFTMSEFEKASLPPRTYSKDELLNYVEHCRNKALALFENFDLEKALSPWKDNWKKEFTLLEITMYNMRHLQHHAAQLNKLLRSESTEIPKWISIAGGGIG